MKKYIYLLMFVLLFNLVSSGEELRHDNLGTFKQGSTVTLIQGCVDSNYSNITKVLFPNSSVALQGDKAMTEESTDFYTYNFSNTDALGGYIVYGHCNEFQIDTQFIYGFDITYGGTQPSLPLIIWYLGAILFLIFLNILLMIAYKKLPRDNDRDDDGELLNINKLKYFKYIIILFIYWIFVAITFIISTTARYYLSDALITKLFFAFYIILMRLSLPFIFVLFIFITLKIFEDKRLKDLWKRGLPTR